MANKVNEGPGFIDNIAAKQLEKPENAEVENMVNIARKIDNLNEELQAGGEQGNKPQNLPQEEDFETSALADLGILNIEPQEEKPEENPIGNQPLKEPVEAQKQAKIAIKTTLESIENKILEAHAVVSYNPITDEFEVDKVNLESVKAISSPNSLLFTKAGLIGSESMMKKVQEKVKDKSLKMTNKGGTQEIENLIKDLRNGRIALIVISDSLWTILSKEIQTHLEKNLSEKNNHAKRDPTVQKEFSRPLREALQKSLDDNTLSVFIYSKDDQVYVARLVITLHSQGARNERQRYDDKREEIRKQAEIINDEEKKFSIRQQAIREQEETAAATRTNINASQITFNENRG